MSRAKIAPILCGFFADSPTGLEYPGYDDARRELRALLAVTRAAAKVLAYGGCGRDVCHTRFDEECPTFRNAKRALARLDRVSKGGSK